MGRKKLSSNVIRAKALRVMVNNKERLLIETAAKAEGFDSLSAWARRALIRAAQTITNPPDRRQAS